jgi:hypothetical protein
MADIAELIRKRQRVAAEKAKPAKKAAAKKPARKKAPAKKSKPSTGQSSVTPAQLVDAGRCPPDATASPAQDVAERSPPHNRWDLFARRYVFGDPPDLAPFCAADAYMSVYDVPRPTAEVNAHRLLDKPAFKPILIKVAASAWERQEVTEDEVLQNWLHASRADVYDYFDEDEAGNLVRRKKSSLSKWQRRNVRKLRVHTDTTIDDKGHKHIRQTVDLEIIDRLKVLEQIARYLNLFTTSLDDNSMETIARMIAAGQERAQRRGVIWNHETGRPEFKN